MKWAVLRPPEEGSIVLFSLHRAGTTIRNREWYTSNALPRAHPEKTHMIHVLRSFACPPALPV